METRLSVAPVPFAVARPWLEEAQRRGDTTGGRLTLAEVCAGADCFAVIAGEQVVGAFAIRGEESEAWIVAAGGRLDGVDMTEVIDAAATLLARQSGTGGLALATRRRGLVAKTQALGWEISSYILRKDLA